MSAPTPDFLSNVYDQVYYVDSNEDRVSFDIEKSRGEVHFSTDGAITIKKDNILFTNFSYLMIIDLNENVKTIYIDLTQWDHLAQTTFVLGQSYAILREVSNDNPT